MLQLVCIIMMAADVLAPIWRQVICNHHDDSAFNSNCISGTWILLCNIYHITAIKKMIFKKVTIEVGNLSVSSLMEVSWNDCVRFRWGSDASSEQIECGTASLIAWIQPALGWLLWGHTKTTAGIYTDCHWWGLGTWSMVMEWYLVIDTALGASLVLIQIPHLVALEFSIVS